MSDPLLALLTLTLCAALVALVAYVRRELSVYPPEITYHHPEAGPGILESGDT